jgi:hypothetical protein
VKRPAGNKPDRDFEKGQNMTMNRIERTPPSVKPDAATKQSEIKIALSEKAFDVRKDNDNSSNAA